MNLHELKWETVSSYLQKATISKSTYITLTKVREIDRDILVLRIYSKWDLMSGSLISTVRCSTVEEGLERALGNIKKNIENYKSSIIQLSDVYGEFQ